MIKKKLPFKPVAVLFDLDGTLVDSAPDLAGAVNALRVARGLPLMPLEALRPFASHGARGLLGAGFGITPESEEFEVLKEGFLDYYEAHSSVHTKLFDGIEGVLQLLENHQIPWGIVTNKHTRFTNPLVSALNLSERASIVVSGDTTKHSKPHPLPLQYSAECLGLAVDRLVYVGDDQRDIQSARSAGYMSAVAAAYGYCHAEEIAYWHADFIVNTPNDLFELFSATLTGE